MKTIDTQRLEVLVREEPGLQLLDVRLAEDYNAGHLPGAANNCIFAVTFINGIEERVSDKAAPVCVYGAGNDSHESRMAYEKLDRNGYSEVYEYRGGVAAWLDAGRTLVQEGAVESQLEAKPSRLLEGEHPIDLEASLVEWAGRNLGTRHWGTVGLQPGVVVFSHGIPISGRVVLDMTSITNANLSEGQGRSILEGHLRSDDFFDTERFPKASIVLTAFDLIKEARAGMLNTKITGDLTLKGITHPMRFLAVTGRNAEGPWIAQGNFDFDRTRWKIIYGSGRFFRNLGMHVVNDLISLQIKIVV